MDAREFLGAVLGDDGYYCVIGIKNPEDLTDPDEKPEQRFFTTVDEAVRKAIDLDETGVNAFFAVARFETNKTRAAFNVKQIKSFFLDIDCGVGKPYATQLDGLKALRTFCKTLTLPKPLIVNSGRGLHVYWTLTEPVSREIWKPVAERFKELCGEHSMHIDAAVPADAARVLRVLGTHNYKDNPAKEVTLIGDAPPPVTFAAFKSLVGESAVKKDYAPRTLDPLTAAISGNFVSRFKTIMLKTLEGGGCEQLKNIVENQATMSEPQWRAGLSIAAYCSDSAKAIHRISSRHPEYSPEATEIKAQTIKGPYLCARFDEYNPGVCPSCKHWEKIKSPISLGREIAEISDEQRVVVGTDITFPSGVTRKYEIPKKFPEPYGCAAGGGIYERIVNDEGDERQVLIYHNPIYVVKSVRDPELGWSAVMRLHLPKDGIREFTIPLSAISSKDEFRKYLSMYGVAVMKIDALMIYTLKWVNMLQMETEVEEARRQFGWTDETFKSFVVGAVEIFADRFEASAPAGNTAGLFPAFTPHGTLEGWKKTIDFYNRKGFEQHQFVVGTAFGSPLMAFTPIHSMIIHLWSRGSGHGKTTAMIAGASVWGDPGVLVLQRGDTMNSKMNRAEVYKNLPLYMDELTNTEPKDLSDMAYQLPNGVQRNRLTSKGNVERFRGVPWKLLTSTTANNDMISRIGLYKAMPEAEAQRILAIKSVRINFVSKDETDDFSSALIANHGHAGPIYMRYVIENIDAVKALLISTQRKLDNAAGLTAENRFWSVGAAVTITGLIIAKKIGLIGFEIAPIANWIVTAMKKSRADSVMLAGDVESIITDYLAFNYNNILRIKSTDDARANDTTGLEKILNPEATPRMGMVGRYEYDVFKLYLLPKPLKEWCGKQQIDYAGLIEGLTAGRTKAHRGKQRLGKGTHVNLPAVAVIVLDCSGFLNDETTTYTPVRSD